MMQEVETIWDDYGYTQYTIVDKVCQGLIQADINDGSTTAVIYNFNVGEPYRGYGNGSKLLEAMEELLHNKGAKTAEVHVDMDNDSRIAWYVKRGYTNTNKFYYNRNVDRDRVILEKTL